jgi:hypothetical protein
MEPNATLAKLSAPEVEEKMYQSAIGLFMYAMIGTRPDLAHAVGVLSQHCANPGEEHQRAVKRVLRYLKETTHQKIVYKKMGDTKFIGYVDTDWGADKNDCRSITGYVFLLGGAAISWSSKKQSSTAQSSTEAEYMAAAHAGKEALWLRNFAQEIGIAQDSPMPLYVDNQSAIALSKNPESHSRMKHIGVRYHFIRDHVESGEIELLYVPTGNQIADVLTKGLTKIKLDKFVSGMGLRKVAKVEAVQ